MLTFFKQKLHNLVSDQKFAEILRGSILVMAARVITTVMTLATSMIVARYYGAKTLGVLAVINSFLLLVTLFTLMGTGTSILRLIPEHIAKYSITSAFLVYRKSQYFVAAISILTGIFFFCTAGIIADKIFSKPHLSFLFSLAAVFVVFKSLMDLNTSAVRGLRLIRTFSFMLLLPPLTMLLFLVAGTIFMPRENTPIYSQLAAFAFTAIVGVLIMARAFSKRMQPDDPVESVSLRSIISLSTPMLMSASMAFFIGQSGVILLGMFRPENEVGYYAIAVKLATLTVFMLQAVNIIAAPKFADLYHSGRLGELFHIARKSSKLIFWSSFPVLIVLAALGKSILALFFGREFIVAYPAMLLLVIGQFISSASGSTGYFLNMTGHQIVFRNIIFLSALINIVLGLSLIPRFGINGAAFAGMTSLAFLNICALLYIKRRFGRTIGYLPTMNLRRIS